MKKLLAIIAVLIMSVGTLSAKDKIYHSAEPLPAAAKTMLKKAFPKSTVNRVKVDSHVFGGADYEVILNDGSEIEFDANGDWKEVDCSRRAVPQVFVLKAIQSYVRNNYKGQSIVKIDKDRNAYDLELSNGVELKFDRSGKFMRIDD